MKNILMIVMLGISTMVMAKDVKIIIPYSPGGATDRVARIIETQLQGGPYRFVFEYRLGAGGAVAANSMVASQDGTVLMVASTALVTAGLIQPSVVRYDVNRDFVLVHYVGTEPLLLVVKSDGEIQNFADLIQQSQTKIMPFGSSGIGTSSHIAGAILAKQQPNFIHVPYKSASKALVDLVSGDLAWVFDSESTISSWLADNKLRPLAVYANKRLKKFPDIPTVKELGFNDHHIYRWHALVANKTADREILRFVQDRLRSLEFENKIMALGIELSHKIDPQQFFQIETRNAKTLIEQLDLR